MTLKRCPLRYAHSNGYTDVCYSSDGKHLLTCGRDGDIRIWLGVEDDDPHSLLAGDYAQCVLLDDSNNIYLANDGLSVQILSFPEGKRMGILTKFTAHVNHIAFDCTRKFLAAGSEDMTVHVVSLADNKVIETISDIEGPVLSVALSPEGKHVAISSGDGSLKIWSVSDKSALKEFNCVPCVNSFASATVLCRTSFEPTNGHYFAYPDVTEVVIVDTKNWSKFVSLSDPAAKGPFSVVAFSPCGNYVAAATSKGCISVWNVASQELLGSTPHPNKHDVCSMVWNPLGNGEIVYCDITGQLGAVEGCNGTSKSNIEKTTDTSLKTIEDIPANFGLSDDDEDDENAVSLEKLKASTTLGPGEDGVLSDTGDDATVKESSRAASRNSVDVPLISSLSRLQAPFQPSSTPSHLNERYLVWNDVGVVRAFAGDDTNPSFIDVNFHDINTHHLMHFRNVLGHTMSSLSTSCLALACEAPSKLVCITLNGNKEWQMDMPDGEEIICVTASETHVSVATDARMLRIFSIYGTQRDIICIPGPVVAVASKANSIIVAYHNCVGIGDDQNIMLMIINIKGISMQTTEMKLPLSPGSSLAWLGFTNLGSPSAYDSSGMLRIFSPKTTAWHPVYDHSVNRKGVSDGLFVISIDEINQWINAISCKGSCYPPITPKPIMSEHRFFTPVCEPESDKSQIEDKFIRALHSQDKTGTILESALKLFTMAVGCDFEQRSFELAEMLTSIPRFVEVAWKYASKRNRITLADKLTELIEKKGEEDKEDELSDNEMISSIRDNREELMCSLSTKENRNDKVMPENVLRPLPVKHDGNNRVVSCKLADSEMESESSNLQDTPPSLMSMIGNSKNKRNPFSKNGKAPFRRHPNPFDVSGSVVQQHAQESKLKSFGSTLGIKRKQPEEAAVNGDNQEVKKQSKLSHFAFSKTPSE